MSELNSPAPQLSLHPQVQEPAAESVQSIQQQPASASPAQVPMLDDSQLTDAERILWQPRQSGQGS